MFNLFFSSVAGKARMSLVNACVKLVEKIQKVKLFVSQVYNDNKD
jgi:hypothetical protein